MGGGKELPYKVPDWRVYKVGDHTPELQKLQLRLAARGLKDPWLRNEVWRFDVTKDTKLMTHPWHWTRDYVFRGFGRGLALALVFTAYTKWRESQSGGHH